MLSLLVLITLINAYATVPEFSFHVFSEPTVLDPQKTKSLSGNYLLFNIHRGLFRYSDEIGLLPDGAKICKRKHNTITCELKSDRRWSNGDPILAEHYVAAFRRLIDPNLASTQSDLLFSVKNARSIWKGEISPNSLGVKALTSTRLRIELEEPDPEFEYKLVHPALAPLPPSGYVEPKNASKQISSGPYVIAEWKPGHFLNLQANKFYPGSERPPAKVYFVDDDVTAARLYRNGKLMFLRRVPNSELEWAKSSPGFKRIAMTRFDYIGFGPSLEDKPLARAALIHSVDFPQFLKLMDTISPPGCPSLPARFMDRTTCQRQDNEAAKRDWGRDNMKKLDFYYSQMGGDDIARTAEWFQNQWKKNLGAKVELKPQEQGVYLRRLKVDPPPIFRKGVTLDRPTCLAALEIFTKGHPDNYIRLNDRRFEELVKALATPSVVSRKKACRIAVEHLLKTNRIIPLGEMYFSILARPEFTGWTLNSLNQLDLSHLSYSVPRP